MAPRWIKTNNKWPHIYGANQDRADDLVLVSGEWVVGRVVPAAGVPGRRRWAWSLIGPHSPEAGLRTHGDAPTLEDAQAAVLAIWRQWQAWAGVRDA